MLSKLRLPRLESYSRDLDGLGFEKFSPIYAHRRRVCFGVVMQPFLSPALTLLARRALEGRGLLPL
jgi:hypothetical protein